MTTHDLGHDLGQGLARSDAGAAPDRDALDALFESSPALGVHTSAAAVTAFSVGLAGAVAAPFSLMLATCLGLGALGVVTSIVGLARASRPTVAGGLLAAIGLVLSLATLAAVGLRYAGIDTAVGDDLLPTLGDWLRTLNNQVPDLQP
jgi:hypothetical protein